MSAGGGAVHRGSVSIIVYDTKQVVYEGIYFVHPAVLGDLGAFTSPRESSLACTCLQTTADMQFWVCYGVYAGAHLGVIVSVLSRYHIRSTLRLQVVLGCNGPRRARIHAGYFGGISSNTCTQDHGQAAHTPSRTHAQPHPRPAAPTSSRTYAQPHA